MSYGRVTRFDKPTTASIYVLHEGLIGVTGEEGLQEVDYSEIEEDKMVRPGKSTDGWLGMTDKYWAVALVPPGSRPFQPRFAYFDDGRPRYQADFLSDPMEVAPGASDTVEIKSAGLSLRVLAKCVHEAPSLTQKQGEPGHVAACWVTE